MRLEQEQEAHFASIRTELEEAQVAGARGRDRQGAVGSLLARPAADRREVAGSRPRAAVRGERGELSFSYLCLLCHGRGVVGWERACDERRGEMARPSSTRDVDAGAGAVVQQVQLQVRCCRCPSGRARAFRFSQACRADEAQVSRVRTDRRDAPIVVQQGSAQGSSWRPFARGEAEEIGSILRRMGNG